MSVMRVMPVMRVFNKSENKNRYFFGNNDNYINTSYISYMCNINNVGNTSNESKLSNRRNFSYKSSNKKKKENAFIKD